MIFALVFLALLAVGALLLREKAHGRERQEIISSHANELSRADRAHRLEMQEVRRQLDEQMLMAKHERAEMFDRLATTAPEQLAAFVRQMPAPAVPEREPDLPVLRFDDDLSLAEVLSN